MFNFDVEITGPEADARALAAELAESGQTAVVPLPPAKSLDPVTMIVVTAAVLQSVDIVYRFYQDWQRRRQAGASARPTITIIVPDGTRILIADKALNDVRLQIEMHQ